MLNINFNRKLSTVLHPIATTSHIWTPQSFERILFYSNGAWHEGYYVSLWNDVRGLRCAEDNREGKWFEGNSDSAVDENGKMVIEALVWHVNKFIGEGDVAGNNLRAWVNITDIEPYSLSNAIELEAVA